MSNITILTDVFSEGVSDQSVSIALIDPATDAAMNTASITAAIATLRSLDTGAELFANTDVLPGSGERGSYPSDGVLRVTFTAADMAAVGGREIQRRELVVALTHSAGKTLKYAVQFPLADVGEV